MAGPQGNSRILSKTRIGIAMSVRRALKVAFIFSILVLVACTANKGLDMVVDVKFFHADGTEVIKIKYL